MSSLEKKAITQSFWVIFGFGGSQFLRLIGNLILTRLLVPELFGLMALVQTFVMGLYLFSDIGITPSIIRSKRGEDPIFLNTAWTIQVFRGVGIWICCLIMTYPVAIFYGETKLLWLIPIIGFTAVISGFSSTSLSSLNRRINLKKLTTIELTTQIISIVITVVWAYFQRSIWALVVGTFVSKIIKVYLSYRISNIKHRFVWEKEALQELISFGRWVFVSTAITFLALQSDKLILGKFFPLEILGVYTVALNFAEIPKKIASKLADKILMPAVSQRIDLPRQQLRKKILNKRKFLLIMSMFIVALMFCFGDTLILLLYEENYQDAAWILPLLALGLWPIILVDSIGKSLFSLGKPQYNAFASGFKFIYMCVLLPLVLFNQPISWGIVVIAFNDVPIYLCISYGLIKEGLSCLLQDFVFTIGLIVLIGILVGLRYYILGTLPVLF